MSNEQLQELALSLLAIKESLVLHKTGADTLYTMRNLNKDLFNYHASEYLSAIFETLSNEINSIDEIAATIFAATEQ